MLGRASERDRHQRRSQGLADQPSGRLQAGRPAAALARRAADDEPVVGRLEETEAEAAHGEPPDERGGARIADPQSNQDKASLVAFLKTLTDQKFLTDPKFSDPFQDRSTP